MTARGLARVEVREGEATALPIEAEIVDVVISNGVLNLVPEKRAAVGEIRRVLKLQDAQCARARRLLHRSRVKFWCTRTNNSVRRPSDQRNWLTPKWSRRAHRSGQS
jgi:ubiquinone/menaquinone biosynthesis C-methylase UbiE